MLFLKDSDHAFPESNIRNEALLSKWNTCFQNLIILHPKRQHNIESEEWSSQLISNLSNWKEEAWKTQGFNGIRTRDLCEYRCDALST